MTFMITTARRMAAIGLCAAVTLTLAALPAAADVGADSYITVTPRDGGAYSMRLICDPDGGYHPHPGAACHELRRVDGYYRALDVDPGPCPRIWDPVEITVHGHWYGRPNPYHEVFPNRCEMERKLGPVV
ncbi:SSI family serine proteinase inhibitor [Nonomuraea sp. NPDC002799]